MKKLCGIHFGAYWMGDNDIVKLMVDELVDLCELTIIDTKIYEDLSQNEWFDEDFQYNSDNPVRWLSHDKVMNLVSNKVTDFVIVNSGGMSLTERTIEELKRRKIICIGISLSDPDVYPYNGYIYAHLYNIFYTNSRYSYEEQYSKGVNIKVLPFAASPRLHHPIEKIEKVYDIVVVGHARPERIKTIKKLKSICKVGTFGSGWGEGTYVVNGYEHVKAINSGKMYLSFSKTLADYTNVKVGLFEAAACNMFLISQIFDEMENYFKYGLEIIGYESDDDLVSLVSFYLENEHLLNWIKNNSYQKFLREHTWKKRWKMVLNDIENYHKWE